MNGTARLPLSALTLPLLAWLVSRLIILICYSPVSSDTHLYLDYAVRGIDLDKVPYRDFTVEYPPLAYWAVALPRVFDPQVYGADQVSENRDSFLYPRYHAIFRLEMALLDAIALAFFVGMVRRRRPSAAAIAVWGYVLIGLLLAPVLYDRLDLGLLALLMMWAYGCARFDEDRSALRWLCWSSSALGLAIAYKWVPILAAPLYCWGVSRGWTPRLLAAAVVSGIGLLPFLGHALSAGSGVWWFLSFHQARGLEVESIWASLLMMLQPWCGEVRAVQGPGSWDLNGSTSECLAHVSTIVLLVLLGALGLSQWRTMAARGERRVMPSYAFHHAALGMVVAGSFAKVFSPQYLVWVLPLLLLLAVETVERPQLFRVVAAVAFLAAVSSWLAPYHLFEFRTKATEVAPNLPTLIVGLGAERPVDFSLALLLFLRNLGIGALIVCVALPLLRPRCALTTPGERQSDLDTTDIEVDLATVPAP